MYKTLIALIIIGAMTGCAGVPAEESHRSRKQPDFAATRPRVEARDALTVGFPKSDIELDVRKAFLTHEAQLFTGLYEGLFSYHPFTMEPIPALAARWFVSEDRKEWTFILKKDARYWNGDAVTAEHFRSAWVSLLEPSRNAPYGSLFDIIEGARDYRLGLIRDPNRVGIIAQDDETLIVRLTAPAAFFRSMLCHHAFSPIHPSMLTKKKWSVEQPLISNGPFYMKEYKPNRITLTKNPVYWDAKNVVLNTLILKIAQDGNEAAALWNTGEARWIYRDVTMDRLTDLSGIVVNPLFSTHYYFIKSQEQPWSDYRVRRALALALPWEQLRQGYLLPAKTLIYAIADYPHVEGFETPNIEEARRLLAEAGYPQGKNLPVLTIRVTPSPEAGRVGAFMARAWSELGVPVKIEPVPFNRYEDALKQNPSGVGAMTWIGDFPDPYTFLEMWRRDSTMNYAGYNDADFEELIDRSMLEEGRRRMETLAEAEKLLLDRGAVLPIFYSPALNIIDIHEIDGWYPNGLDIHPFKYLSYKETKPLPGIAALPRRTPAASRIPAP